MVINVSVKLPDDTAREGAQLARDFGATLGEGWSALVGIASDRLVYARSVSRLRLVDKFKEECKRRGIDGSGREVAPAFLVPLIEAASLETDDDLQNVWSVMLANAVDAGSDIEMRTAYVSMLSQMTHLDVTILSALDVVSKEHPETRQLATDLLPNAVGLGHSPGIGAAVREDVQVSLANLSRLGCLHPAMTYGGLSFQSVTLTALGRAFVRACSPKG